MKKIRFGALLLSAGLSIMNAQPGPGPPAACRRRDEYSIGLDFAIELRSRWQGGRLSTILKYSCSPASRLGHADQWHCPAR